MFCSVLNQFASTGVRLMLRNKPGSLGPALEIVAPAASFETLRLQFIRLWQPVYVHVQGDCYSDHLERRRWSTPKMKSVFMVAFLDKVRSGLARGI